MPPAAERGIDIATIRHDGESLQHLLEEHRPVQ
jgi:hypothetical protein